MSASDDLMAAYQTWLDWTQSEGEAIRSTDWPRVGECQAAKRQLQPQIVQLRAAAEQEWRRLGLAGIARERSLRTVVEELIRLESQNRETLAAQRVTFSAQKAELDRSTANLRRVRQSYVPLRAAAWSSFS
jgi:hypothetical protein